MSKQAIQLSDHFTVSRLLRFVVPCIGTMLFTSIYGIVDGLCVSNFVGKTAFAAVNLIMPLPMLIGTVGFMLGTGGSAIVAITLGEGDKKGRQLFQPVSDCCLSSRRGRYQYGAGCGTGGASGLERGGRSHCHLYQPNRRWCAAGVLFSEPKQHQPPAPEASPSSATITAPGTAVRFTTCMV